MQCFAVRYGLSRTRETIVEGKMKSSLLRNIVLTSRSPIIYKIGRINRIVWVENFIATAKVLYFNYSSISEYDECWLFTTKIEDVSIAKSVFETAKAYDISQTISMRTQGYLHS